MTGKFVDNGANNLIIVFQSAGRVPTSAIDLYLKKNISYDQIERYHQKYNWFNFSHDRVTADYYFIEDHYSGIYGWYITDFGENIITKVQKEINEICEMKNYHIVLTYGSSKGGTGALLHGLINPYVNKIMSLVPQVDVARYLDMHLPMLKQFMMSEDLGKINKDSLGNILNFIDIPHIKKKKTVFLYTGVLDEQFLEIYNLSKEISSSHISSTLIVNVQKKKHSAIVMDNLVLINQLIDNILCSQRTKNVNLLKIKSKLFVYFGDQG